MSIRVRPGLWVLAFFGGLAALSGILDFNGLYGQDAHEYLRWSRALFERLQGRSAAPAGPGEAELAGGYPLAAAIFQYFGLGAARALQGLSWLSAAGALWFFERNLRVLSPGARGSSRWVFGMLTLGLAPCFLRAGLTMMSDAFGLMLAMIALFFGLRSIELQRPRDVVGFAVFAALAITSRYALGLLLALPALALALERWRERQRLWLMAALAAGVLAFLPLWWLWAVVPGSPLGHSLLADWSVLNFFKRTFTQASGSVSYLLPNLAYLLFPLMHPWFCLTLPALLLLAKRTDVHLYSKRILALSLAVYLLFLGGLAHQNARYLLPAYAVLLLLLFPAWDRFFAYGLYFFKRLTCFLIGLTLACQLFFSVRILRPVLARHAFEQEVASLLRADLKPGDRLYAFDLDIALQSYLPQLEYHNLWVQRYDSFPPGSYFLFNAPKLRQQWTGQPPMLNWEHAVTQYNLEEIRQLPEGWVLYRVVKHK
ncbi:MAG: glycosyltransferase family 39 protein [Saprospirales bacterium]|nr:glycosyltransferase family 39 protein [Saprospirales bacterium]